MRISGKVQGVWYRASTQAEARGLGLTGWVRNRVDGSVEAEVQGREDQVERLVAWCHEGPRLAWVQEVRQEPLDLIPAEVGFELRSTA